MKSIEDNGIVYQLLDREKADETTKLVNTIFIEEDFITKGSYITWDEFNVLSRAYMELNFKEPLSLTALDKETNEVVGFSITEGIKSKNAIDPDIFLKVSDHFYPFNNLLEELHKRFLNIKFKEKECYHLFLLGVKPSYRRRRIGIRLIQYSEKLASSLGYKYVMIEATSPVTKPICEKLGYSNLGNIPYKNYILDGKKPFAHVTNYDGPYLFLKKIF